MTSDISTIDPSSRSRKWHRRALILIVGGAIGMSAESILTDGKMSIPGCIALLMFQVGLWTLVLNRRSRKDLSRAGWLGLAWLVGGWILVVSTLTLRVGEPEFQREMWVRAFPPELPQWLAAWNASSAPQFAWIVVGFGGMVGGIALLRHRAWGRPVLLFTSWAGLILLLLGLPTKGAPLLFTLKMAGAPPEHAPLYACGSMSAAAMLWLASLHLLSSAKTKQALLNTSAAATPRAGEDTGG